MAARTDSEARQAASQDAEYGSTADESWAGLPVDETRDSAAAKARSETTSSPHPVAAPIPRWDHGWPIPSSLSPNAAEARSYIQLPEFDPLLLQKARVISGRFPFAEAEY